MDNHRKKESNKEKKQLTCNALKKTKIKSKVERAITIWKAIEKGPILEK